MRKPAFILLFSFVFLSVVNAQTNIIKANDAQLQYEGRVIFKGDSAALSWTGNSVKIAFKGTALKATLRDEHGKNFFKVIVDGKVLEDIHIDTLKHDYTLVSGLKDNLHIVQLFKRTEWIFGKTWFYGFGLGSSKLVRLKSPSKRKIEFYGNSITCGYAVTDSSGKDRGTPEYEDGYRSYAALTARHFGAQYTCIARSGIGLMVSWFPQIMPELYDLSDPFDAALKWDFKTSAPNVVLVNLFQNDSWILKQPTNLQFGARFGKTPPSGPEIVNAYKNFITSLRSKYPKTSIICILGNMDITKVGSPWPGYVKTALEQLNDQHITYHFFAYKNTPGHPKVAEQQAMADDLIGYINKTIKW